jgi:hypothetical protein
MTRINVGIAPARLPTKLLIAEHREITRIPNAVTSGRARLDQPPVDEFRLGPGHVRFFYTRLGYLADRYQLILTECRHRGYDVTDKTSAFEGVDRGTAYVPSERDRGLILKRFAERGYELQRMPARAALAPVVK